MDTKFVSLMSGVRQVQPASPPAAQRTDKAEAKAPVEKTAAADEKTTVSSTALAAPENEEGTEPRAEATLDEVVEELNRNIQQTTRALKFTVDERQGKPVVSVVDKETDEIIRQIPSEVALQVADALEEVTGVLVSEHA